MTVLMASKLNIYASLHQVYTMRKSYQMSLHPPGLILIYLY
jgi:hypothetical protein